MPPAIPERGQLRLSLAGVVFDVELVDRSSSFDRPHDHLRGELHAGAVQLEPGEGVAAQRAHPAVRIVDP